MMDRRTLLVRAALLAAVAAGGRRAAAQEPVPAFGYPIGLPERAPADRFVVRHGYATENTWFAPGNLHAGEDWYATEGDTAGALVYAIADGEVLFAGSDYPGRVVIVRHAPDLYSMYGHLDYDLPVAEGDSVEPGDVVGSVLARSDDVPNHLHFEVRTFLTTPEVNGAAPRYGFACGPNCPPGPGYWPIGAPDHPSDQDWRNPTHVVHARAFPDGVPADGTEVVVTASADDETTLWSAPGDADGAEEIGTLPLRPGDRFPLLAVETGPEATAGSGAETYRLWYRIAPPDGAPAWVQAAVPFAGDTGSDGRPSSIRFDFVPATGEGG
ncbi:MAG: M23 family metallopeptidase [Chloroflexota bacterium]|nr:M23 family metallopeptidase [Chloroflexota bacterium]